MREIAQLLSYSDLGEVSFEAGKGQRLTIKRRPVRVSVAAPIAGEPGAADEADVETSDLTEEDATSAIASDATLVASPCVGVFHAAKVAVEVATAVKRKQLLGTVESLKVPNEIYAPADGVVSQMWVSDGQGVEWGQPLFEIQPSEALAQ